MSRNGSGTYTLPAGNPVVTGTTISSSTMNSTLSDIATALTGSVAADGQTPVTGNINMGSNRLTALASATARTDAPTGAQVQDNTLQYLTSVSGTNTVTASAALTMSAYATGQRFTFLPANTNTGATTININSIGAKVVWANGGTLVGGELITNMPVCVVYDGTRFHIDSEFSFVTPDEFGAVGDGSTDDATALSAAAATGRFVLLVKGKVYKHTTDITLAANYQTLAGPGTLKPDGAVGVIVNGGAVGVRVDVNVESSTHSGVAVTVNNANRTYVNLNGVDVYNGVYVTKANTTWISGWATCRGYGVTLYGDNSNRSDLVDLNMVVSVGAGKYGLDWDGAVHSVRGYIGVVCGSSVSAGNGYGVTMRNTSGGATTPAIGRLNVEVDYSGTHGINVQAGLDFDFPEPYVNGSTGAGLIVGAAVNDYQVRVTGGKLVGNTTYGIASSGGVVLFSGSTDLSNNTTDETTGSVWTKSPRFALDANAYFTITSSNPVVTFDTNDYIGYDRGTNTLTNFIGASAVQATDATRSTFGVRPRLPTATVAGLPGVHLAGDMYFATNARVNGQGAGAGTGGIVVSNGTNWIIMDTGATVAA